ncbi:thrombospondin type-1 domain-containing protein 7A-like [Saccoglossus kowalevskii]|uniref:Thrombospondin type-1 domain-containing protein 7A-like n=1 Tax=Saccoglossus kowalevskii TaxID=10224 RepID=A0ABM0MW11_SACKO|nr:PREDICTED: thrombospondin type-1 domain-containing protein 7A-like [Saccoglossus kowalevskii]
MAVMLKTLLCLCSLTSWRWHSGLFVYAQEDQVSEYIWKTGSWGTCHYIHCGYGGTQTRSAWCIHRDGRDTLKSNCDAATKPSMQRRCFKVCDEHRHLFEWEIGEWNKCEKPLDYQIPSNEVCGSKSLGTQTRTVMCLLKSRNIVIEQNDANGLVDDDFCEHFSSKPALSQSCLIPCPQECIVSHYSDWSECTRTCGNGTQIRTRHVLVPSMYGGKECPRLAEIKPCNELPTCMEKHQYSYKTKISPWSSCAPNIDFTNSSVASLNRPVIGYQKREVTCTRSDGKSVSKKLCFDNSNHDNIPLYQSCVLAQDCKVTEWSDWNACSQTCTPDSGTSMGYRMRYRDVTLLPLGDGIHCPQLHDVQSCTSTSNGALIPCPRYTWHVSAYGECSTRDIISRHEIKHLNINGTLCGGGLQRREVFCTQVNDTDYRPVDNGLCSPPQPSYVRECHVPCSMDCLVSPWSEWGMCLINKCALGDKINKKDKGHSSRTRTVVQHAQHGGRSCPPLVEARPCDSPICYFWYVGEFTRCLPIKVDEQCGAGAMVRPVFCTDNNNNEVDASNCVLVSAKPMSEKHCEIPCPNDCVLSTWSPWNECSKTCEGKQGENGTQSRVRTILAYQGKGGNICPGDDKLTEYRECNKIPCNAFTWRTKSWSDCEKDTTVGSNVTLTHGNCFAGRMTRNVYCSKAENDKEMPERKCMESQKPVSSMQCEIPCAKDCVTTAFSDWTPCSTTCIPGEKLITSQERQRYVLEYGTSGDCPDTLHEKRECDNSPQCYSYDWMVLPWQDCILPDDGNGVKCGDGLQSRDVSCLREDGEPVDIKFCLKYADTMPNNTQSCRVYCINDCELNNWSKFGKCSKDCIGQRSRKRRLSRKSRHNTECQNTDLYPLLDSEMCTCPPPGIITPIGNWSDCFVKKTKDKLGRDKPLEEECGEGLKFKRVICLDQNGKIVPNSVCGLKEDFMEAFCDLPCPSDCKLSPWSEWSTCSKTCGTGMKTRSRYLKEREHNNGRQCPYINENNDIVQEVPCHTDCSHYVWVAEPWLECDVYTYKGELCGAGWQRREVQCMSRLPGKQDAIVDPMYCDKLVQPEGARVPCVQPCPGDCVVSDWSEWSQCDHPCSKEALRHRHRFIERHPSLDGGICPVLNETQGCSDTVCFDYEWSVSAWSTCQLNDNAVCGKGKKNRFLECIRTNDGSSVSLDYCAQFSLNYKPNPLSAICHIECPLDCQMSQWTEWSQCTHTCGYEGLITRSRHIVKEPNTFGRMCPTSLVQYKPCALPPCYHWVIDEWKYCETSVGDCGHGNRRRNVTCQQADGVEVDDFNCYGNDEYHSNKMVMREDFERMQTQQVCTTPCPGECDMSPWSDWSPCLHTCIEGNKLSDIDPIQVRSKAAISSPSIGVCHTDIYETRVCHGQGECFEYHWHASDWTDDGFRNVWCQRSDGLNVTGGCLDSLMPSSERKCHPECTVEHSFCTEGGVCACDEGFAGAISSLGFLEVCLLLDNRVLEVEYSTVMYTDEDNEADKSKYATNSSQDFPQMWLYGAIAAGVLFLVLIIVITYIACKITRRKNAERRLQKDKDRYWDVNAKKRYNADIDV